MTPVLIVFIIFGSVASLFLVPTWLRSRERQKMQETLRAAIERGQTLPPEVIDAMTSDVKVKRPPSPDRDLRTGIVWTGIGVGFAALAFALSFEDADSTYPLLGVAAFPTFIGLAFILMSFLGRGRK
jgi:hypothetical protein